jgi:N-acetylglucosaminyl-diphospho-decaprenol L-rhamnosyltransferase
MDLSVIIVSYNTRDLLRACLRSIHEQTKFATFEVVVVDNASQDGSAAMMRDEFPDVKLFVSEKNLGFGPGCNRAVAMSSGEYLVLLNPDTLVLDRALDQLLEFYRAHPRAGLAGGRTLRPNGAVDPSSCWAAPTLWSMFCYATGLSTTFPRTLLFDPESMGRWPRDAVRPVGVVTGCLLLASRKVWDQLGGFDERFFMYGEDVDLSLRATKLGYTPMITPAATIVHVVGASSASLAAKRKMLLAGKVTLMDKHWPPAVAQLGRALLTIGTALRAFLSRLTGRSSFWVDAWDQREVWRAGWPAVDPSAR